MGFLILIDRTPQQMPSCGMREGVSSNGQNHDRNYWQESFLVTTPISINLFIYVIIAVLLGKIKQMN